MCKFNSRLFVFLFTVLLVIFESTSRPIAKRSVLDSLINGNDYDLKYDQRQKGTENVRIKLDGFFIGVPAEPQGLFVLTDELVNVLGDELLLARHGEGKGETGESKAIQSETSPSESDQKQSQNLTDAEKADEAGKNPQKSTAEGRVENNPASRTKVYIMKLLDYIR